MSAECAYAAFRKVLDDRHELRALRLLVEET